MSSHLKGIKKTYSNTRIETDNLCEYGCELVAKFILKNEKLCCHNKSSSCPELIRKSSESRKGAKRTKESREKMSKAHIGQKSKKKGKTYEEMFGKERSDQMKKQMRIAKRRTIKELYKKFPFFCMVEELRECPKTGEIQVHCKNHNCSNSKENGGWFIPTYSQLYERYRAINNPSGFEENNFYCSEKCKKECRLYGKTPTQLMKDIEIEQGTYEEDIPFYTSEEYQTFRQEVLKRDNNKCLYCDEPATDVHHTKPQKLEPFFALDPDLAISCCEECHYKYGHKTGTECSTGNIASKECDY